MGDKDVKALSDYSSHTRFADLKGFVVYNEKGQEVVNFGKHKGKVLEEVLQIDHGYADWVRRSDFPSSTKRVFESVQQRLKEKELEEKKRLLLTKNNKLTQTRCHAVSDGCRLFLGMGR